MIVREEHDGVTVLRLEHGKVSALDLELLRDLSDHLEASRGPSTGAVVLTGSGSTFSAGVDLKRFLDEGVDYIETFYDTLIDTFLSAFLFEKPLVAAVNGHAIAGGCILAQCGDARLLVEDGAKIGVPELLVGVPFPMLALEIVRSSLHPGFVNRTILGGALYTPDEALYAGLTDRVCPGDSLLDQGIREARRLATISPAVFSLTKRTLRSGVVEAARRAEPTEDEVRDLWLHPETRVRIEDYLSRTVGRQ